MSLAVLFLRRGLRGTWTCRTWDTRFWVLAEGRAERSDTGDMSDFVERLSLKFLDTEGSNRPEGDPEYLECRNFQIQF